MLYNRFGYVPYDSISGNQQNELRDHFKLLESQILNGDASGVEKLVIPNNEYAPMINYCQSFLLVYLSSGKLQDALIELEMLYFLLGKEIRIQCIERLKSKIAEM
jgi:hypothetical protein